MVKGADPVAGIVGGQAMRSAKPIIAFVTLLTIASVATAESLQSLKSSGWTTAYNGTVSDDFNGCDHDLPVPLDGGFIFVCREYNYHYAYRPDFLVLKKGGQTKYVIDDQVFDGDLYRGTATITYVSGEFSGCEHDKVIMLDNGLVFQCRMYSYSYSYRPKVVIVGDYVTIGGKRYTGTLYRR